MITSVNNQRIKEINALRQKKKRDENSLFLVEGWHMTEEALKSGLAQTVITSDPNFKCDNETLYVSENVIKKLATTKTPQPYLAVCKKKANKLIAGHRYLLLDRVQDPGNLGTMLRTALALGIDQVIISDDSVDLYNEKVLRATQGAIFRLPVLTADLDSAIKKLKEYDVRIIGTALKGAKPIKEIKKMDKMAFVVGNEGQGVSEKILNLCDDRLYIPISRMESLNVAIAAGIIIYTYQEDEND